MIQTIAFITGGIGLLLILLLAGRLKASFDHDKLAKHRSTQAGVADLLNYAAMVDDGVIVGKNGAFTAAYLYAGDDNASSTDEERNNVALRMNQALASLGNGWMVHVDAVRRPAINYPDAGLSAFPDPVSQAVDEERRRYFESLGTMYEGYFVVAFTWFPPSLAQRKFVELMFDDDSAAPSNKARTNALIDQFKRELASLENRLTTGLKLTRLKGEKVVNEDGTSSTHDGLLSWLQFCITGRHQPMLLPSNPMYLDALLGGQELWTGSVPRIGRHFIQCVNVEGFPLESYPGILSALAELPSEYRWSSRFIFMDRHEAVAHMEKFRKKWKQKIRGFFDQIFQTNSGKVDQNAIDMVADADGAVADLNTGLVASGYYTSVIVLMDEDRQQLDASARAVEKAVMRLGFAARIETVNTVDAYLGTLPGHGVENVRRPLINTLNLAHMLPTSSIWTGKGTAPCPLYPPLAPALLHGVTHGQTPFRLNLHVRDLGHALMFGPTRAGKSTHLGLIAFQALRYQGMSVYSFDKGMSMYPTTKAVRGLHFEVGSDDGKLAFCPLQYLATPGDRAWAMEWIDVILALNGVNTTPVQRGAIGEAIMSMHRSGARTLSEFTMTVQDEGIREALKQYTVDGMMGHLLDAQEDGLAFSNFTTFEIEELMNLGEKYALPVLLYLFRRIEQSLRGQPAIILLDEAWIMLGHPAFRGKIKEWLKAFAKKNCAVLLATQSLSDAANSGILDVLVESTATKIFLPNSAARDEEVAAPLYRRMGLNNRQIEILATAIPKRQYYALCEDGRRLYELALGPLALAFVGATDKDSVAQIKQLEARYGDAWVHHWLAARNLNLNDYLE